MFHIRYWCGRESSFETRWWNKIAKKREASKQSWKTRSAKSREEQKGMQKIQFSHKSQQQELSSISFETHALFFEKGKRFCPQTFPTQIPLHRRCFHCEWWTFSFLSFCTSTESKTSHLVAASRRIEPLGKGKSNWETAIVVGVCSWLWRNKKKLLFQGEKGSGKWKVFFSSFFSVESWNRTWRTEKNLYNWVVSRSFVRLLFASSSRFFCVCCIFSSTVLRHFLFYSVRLSASLLLLCLSSFISFSLPAASIRTHFESSAECVKERGRETERERTEKNWIWMT